MGEVGAAERDGEEKRNAEACVFISGGCAPCSTCASWKRRMSSPVAVSGERLRNLAKVSICRIIVVLCLLAKAAHGHVFDHARPKWADGPR